ncbi:zeta toxin family protein [Sphingomonas sp.]|uniref:zeta toxin family protein n=1 Tax=Sphingomonas sp. TaxID=28214 RepID=UPI000DB4EE80|nr:zeta toxin family protein [Sphingomonas sp.]PZU10062.1 MAG: hypothetical protein DI605_05525 [Sphingomonas sp.]
MATKADLFRAAFYAWAHNSREIDSTAVLAHLNHGQRARLLEIREALNEVVETVDIHRQNGTYTRDRLKLHQTIISRILDVETLVRSTPRPGRRPIMMMLGGRGGSGKSWFRNRVYDEAFLVIDPDAVKAELPGYEGWNAFAFHEESSDIVEVLVRTAAALGLNVVLDVTMKSRAGALQKLSMFAGTHDIFIHYMFLPRIDAAVRASIRAAAPGGRYVPIEVILDNRDNEAVFDEARNEKSGWSFRDNLVSMGEHPKLISEYSKNTLDPQIRKPR